MNRLALLETILDTTDLICYVVDYETYELVYINKATKNTVGILDDSYMGQKCYKLLQGSDKICDFCTNKYLTVNKSYKWENYNSLLRKYFDLSDTLIEIEGRKLRLEFAVDITEKKNELFKLKNQLTVEETLVRCAQTLSGDLDVHSAIYRLLAVVCDFYKADRAYIFEMDEGGETFSNTYEWCLRGVEPQIKTLQRLNISVLSDWLVKFDKEGYFCIDNLKNDLNPDSEEYKILQPQKISSLIAAPLNKNGSFFGMVGVDNPRENMKDAVLLRSISLFIIDDLEKRKNVKELEKLSFVDNLTGLYNRHKYMNEILDLSNGSGKSVGILYADINGLKSANDDYGHEYGDKLILRAAANLRSYFPDAVYRIGGDEFVVLSYDTSAEQFDGKVKKLRQALEKQDDAFMSFGSVWCEDSRDINRYVTYADEFMYIDKQNYYKNSAGESKKYRATVASDLMNLINNNNFTVYLQPKVNLDDGKVIGAEALLRKESRGGIIEPYKFLYVYEKTGLINYLDLFVLEKVCSIIKEWKRAGLEVVPVAVNFSRYTVMEYEIADKIKAVCDKYGVACNEIMIEITEHVGGIKGVALSEVLSAIKNLGFRISLDDFGSEYSSIATLSEIEFDEVKLDKSLADKITSGATAGQIVRHLISLCNSLKGTSTLVEGIETVEQRELLKNYGCKLGQGYLFARPMPVDSFTEKFLTNKKKSKI